MDLAFDPIIAWTARLLLALVLATAALGKLRALDEFIGVVHNYRVLPELLVRPVAYGLPPLELLLAIGLLLEPTRTLAAPATATLLAVFALAMAINIGRGRTEIDCGCFANALRQRIGWALVVRNLVLIGLALLALPVGPPARPLVWLDLVTIATATAAGALLYVAFSRLASVAPLAPSAMPGHRHA
jgi:Methylamine utilisation protein MauE